MTFEAGERQEPSVTGAHGDARQGGSVISRPGDVVVVPFPFVERAGSRRRPALVLSATAFNRAGHTVLAMITTSSHSPSPGDVMIAERQAAGLKADCLVRLKLFTLDNRLIIRSVGRLAAGDQRAVDASLAKYLGARLEVEALADSVHVTDDELVVTLVDGRTIHVPVAWFPRVMHGTREERSDFQLIGRGTGIHWPRLDEDISIEGLLAGHASGEAESSLQHWLESRDENDTP